MKRLLFLFASIAMMVACTESETGGDEPTPQPQKPTITIETPTQPSFAEEGGEGTISFTASEAWTAEVINTRADSWVSIHPTSGGAGEANITVTTEPNDTPDDRSATIVIKSGTVEKTVKISQKQKDALTVTSAIFEVGNEGGEINVEVKANIDFEYEIDEAAKEWVEYKGTRAIETSTLTFAVAENDDVEKREAKIHITSGEFDETITIYQAGAEPTLVISQSEYAVPSVGETIVVEVVSNVDVTVELPADADWISESTTRSVSTNTFYFDIAANEEYDQRKAEIKFSNAEKGLAEVVTIVQAQKDAIVIAEDSYSVSGQGDAIEIAVGHNVEFDIEIDVDWISQVQTRALETSTLIFNVAQNETDAERSGTITFTSKDNDEISQVIAVKQEAGASKIYYTSYDGQVAGISRDNTDWGGAQIVSNTYENGQGVITFDGLITLIDGFYFNGSKLSSITIPESVTAISNVYNYVGVNPFENCTYLSEIYGKYASADNKCLIIDNKLISTALAGLTSYNIPEGVTSIEMVAVYNWKELVDITIPESVTKIGYLAFCASGLTSINIPQSVTEIDASAFLNCNKLAEVNCNPTTPPTLGKGAFDNNASNRKIIVPYTAVADYKAASGWSAYANFIEGINPDAPNQQGTLPVLNKESIASKLAGEFDRGGEGVGYHDLSQRNGGTPDVEGAGNIGYTTSGEWLAYTVYVKDAGKYRFNMYGSCSASAGTYSGEYQWFLEDPYVEENALGPRFKLQSGGGWGGPWMPSEAVEFELSEGYHRIIFYMHNATHNIYKFTAEWAE